jgi:hypothetical protein
MVYGIKYKLPIVESFLNWTHGLCRYIKEIYIPEFKIAFNEDGYVFKTNEDIDILKEYLNAKENINKLIEKYFSKKIDK